MKFHLASQCLVYWRALHTRKRPNRRIKVWQSGEKKRDSVDKATGAHYLIVYAGPRRAIDGCQRRVWSRQMGLHPTFHTKDDWAGITRPLKWHVGAVILDYLSASLSFAARLRVVRCTSDKITNGGSATTAVRPCLICIVKYKKCAAGDQLSLPFSLPSACFPPLILHGPLSDRDRWDWGHSGRMEKWMRELFPNFATH